MKALPKNLHNFIAVAFSLTRLMVLLCALDRLQIVDYYMNNPLDPLIAMYATMWFRSRTDERRGFGQLTCLVS